MGKIVANPGMLASLNDKHLLYADTQAGTINELMLAKYNLVKNNPIGTYYIAGGWKNVQFGFTIVSIIASSAAMVVFHGATTSYKCLISNNTVSNLVSFTTTEV